MALRPTADPGLGARGGAYPRRKIRGGPSLVSDYTPRNSEQQQILGSARETDVTNVTPRMSRCVTSVTAYVCRYQRIRDQQVDRQDRADRLMRRERKLSPTREPLPGQRSFVRTVAVAGYRRRNLACVQPVCYDTGLALRPPRSIATHGSSPISWPARSSSRPASMRAPSASSVDWRTMMTLFSMSSCDQPREWAM
jgi:hypothetical protein